MEQYEKILDKMIYDLGRMELKLDLMEGGDGLKKAKSLIKKATERLEAERMER